MPELLSPIRLRRDPVVPTTPLCSSGAPLTQTDPSLVPGAPVKKYPARKRRLAERGTEFWQNQPRNTDLQDPFDAPSVDSKGTPPNDFVRALTRNLEADNGGHRVSDSGTSESSRDIVGVDEPSSQIMVHSEVSRCDERPEADSSQHGAGDMINRAKPVEALARPSGRGVLEGAALRAEVNRLRLRVGRLERTERRLQQQLRLKSEELKDTKVVAEEAQTAAIVAEETIVNLEQSARVLRGQANRYQGWWLTEFHSLKVVLSRLPVRERQDFTHIAASSKARFETYCTDL